MKISHLKIWLIGMISFGPAIAVAAPKNFKDLMYLSVDILNAIIPVIVLIALVVFLWGVLKFMKAEGDDRSDAKALIVYGLIGLFVMISVFGLLKIVTRTFGLNNALIIEIEREPINIAPIR